MNDSNSLDIVHTSQNDIDFYLFMFSTYSVISCLPHSINFVSFLDDFRCVLSDAFVLLSRFGGSLGFSLFAVVFFSFFSCQKWFDRNKY